MQRSIGPTVSILLSLTIPFVIMVPSVVLTRALAQVSTWPPVAVSILLLILSAGAGFAVLARIFRRQAIIIALAYFPVMVGLLYYFGLFLVGAFYGDAI